MAYLATKNYTNINFGKNFTTGIHKSDIYGQELMTYNECQTLAKKLGIEKFDINNQEVANYILDGLNLLRLKTKGKVIMPKEVKFVNSKEIEHDIMKSSIISNKNNAVGFKLLVNEDYFTRENIASILRKIIIFNNETNNEMFAFAPPNYTKAMFSNSEHLKASIGSQNSSFSCSLKMLFSFLYTQKMYEGILNEPESFYRAALKEDFAKSLDKNKYPVSGLEHYNYIKSDAFEKEILENIENINTYNEAEKKDIVEQKRKEAFFYSLKNLRAIYFNQGEDFPSPMPINDEFSPLYEKIGIANYILKNYNNFQQHKRNDLEFNTSKEIRELGALHRNALNPLELAGSFLDYYVKDFKLSILDENLKNYLINRYNIQDIFD